MKRFFIALLCITTWTSSLHAQWAGNPANPLLIDKSQYHLDPEIKCADGQYLFCWVSAAAVRRKLAAYDFSGFRQWSNDDPLRTTDWVSAGNDISWQNLWTDHASNSILVQLTQNKRTMGKYITVSKNNPDGENCWTTGQALYRSDCNAEEFWLSVSDRNDMFLAVRGIEKGSLRTDLSLYKILENGTVGWEYRRFFYENNTVALDSHITLLPDQLGRCFIVYEITNQIPDEHGASFIDTYLKINLFDQKGSIQWEKDVVLYYQKYKFFEPAAILGNDGSLYCLWGHGYMQKVHPDGYPLWDIRGIQVISDYSIREVALLETGLTGDIRVFYTANDWNRSALVGQRISPDGVLKWGARGIRIVDIPYSMWGGGFNLASYQDTTLIAYDEPDPADPDYYRANLVLADRNGKKIWRDPKVLYTVKGGESSRAGITSGHNRQFLISWFQWNNGSDRLYAQNIFTDGTMGTRSSFTGEKELPQQIFKGYDPGTRSIFFEPQPGRIDFALMNVLGQTLFSGEAAGRIQVPLLIAGIYVLIIHTNRKVLETRKILIH